LRNKIKVAINNIILWVIFDLNSDKKIMKALYFNNKIAIKFIVINFICIINIFSLHGQVAIEWQKCYGGEYSEYSNSIAKTIDGGLISAGIYYGSGLTTDILILKLDSEGEFQWQKILGGTNIEEANSVIQSFDGGYLVSGNTYSNDGDVEGNHGSSDIWIIKLDSLGDIQWQQCYGDEEYQRCNSIEQTTDDGYIITGSNYLNFNYGEISLLKIDSVGTIQWENFYGGTYGEISGSVHQLGDGGYALAGSTESVDGDVLDNNGEYDFWFLKLDSLGNILFQNSLGGSGSDYCNSMQLTPDGGFLLAGTTFSFDGDVSENDSENPSAYQIWIVKLNAQGDFLWEKCFGGTNDDVPTTIQLTYDGGFIIAGATTSNNGDVDQNYGGQDCWIFKIDALGNLLWQKSFGGTDTDLAYSILSYQNGTYVFSGRTDSNDNDVFGNNGAADSWIVKLTENYNTISGNLFTDLNSNFIKDSNEFYIPNHKVTETNTDRFDFTNASGEYLISVLDSGNYSVSLNTINYYNAAPETHSAYFDDVNQIDSLNDFAMQPAGIFNDLTVQLTPMTFFRSGFEANYMINYKNIGTTSLSPKIVFTPDQNLSYISSSITPTSISADSIVWYLPEITPYQTENFLFIMKVDSGVPNGTSVFSEVEIESVFEDADETNNNASSEVITIGSFDPNDISVNNTILYPEDLDNPAYLQYLIRFQNTGNDTAFTVRVTNEISQKLQANTIEFIASSHPVEMIYNLINRELIFKFNNINLPDSNVNYSLSNGFIRYKIKPINTLEVGDSITSMANIYFDFNTPVATNTAVTTVALPSSLVENKFLRPSLQLIPNPATNEITITTETENKNSEIKIYDFTGKLVLSKTSTNSQKTLIDISALNAGIYFVKVGNDFGKFVKI
jgi:uncharacterized protein (DUF1330 family)